MGRLKFPAVRQAGHHRWFSPERREWAKKNPFEVELRDVDDPVPLLDFVCCICWEQKTLHDGCADDEDECVGPLCDDCWCYLFGSEAKKRQILAGRTDERPQEG